MDPFRAHLLDYFRTPGCRTKAAVARDAGISRVYLHRLLAGRRNVSLDVARRLASAMGTNLGKIERKSVARS